ncbi:MAG: Cupin [Betaproteobacteria bacterium]|nr:Cupin [Betaproteobacteria bacterium]
MIGNASGARKFLAEFWQKKPLLKRGALPQLAKSLDRKQMMALACRDDVESRLVIYSRKNWQVEHGPFGKRELGRLPARNWTLLVNGLEAVLPQARELQQQFSFIPYARHDDVMASYAVPGGSVGPHFDSYDVFLVQGAGTRRWQTSRQRNLDLVAGAPLKILRDFRPQRELTVHAGDVLYLPPRYAHHGVALDECITWSVGFRAPGRREIIERFLDFMRDRERVDAMYQDPDLKAQQHAGAIGKAMLEDVKATLASIRWTDADIERCLGEYLTEPRAGVVFNRARHITPRAFKKLLDDQGACLALPTRMLTSGNRIFINGESAAIPAGAANIVRQFADNRYVPAPLRAQATVLDLLYAWYCAGYIKSGLRP